MAKKYTTYTLTNGERAPSVTTILQMLNKPALNDWRARLGIKKTEEIKNTASDFGNLVHSGVEAVCSEQQIPYYSDVRVKTAVENFKLWADANIQEWIAFEKAAYNDTFKYAGTVDAFARLKNGKLVLIDLKTSKKVNWEYYLQTVAYARAERFDDNVVDPKDIEGILILHLIPETMTWEALHVQDPQEELWKIFKCLCYVYPFWKKANDER